jgi:hypothetical protein
MASTRRDGLLHGGLFHCLARSGRTGTSGIDEEKDRRSGQQKRHQPTLHWAAAKPAWRHLAPSLLVSALLSACGTSNHSALNPASGEADLIANLWWIMLAGGSVIFIAVIVLLLMGIKRQSRAPAFSGRETQLETHDRGWCGDSADRAFLTCHRQRHGGTGVIAQTPANAMTVEVIGRLWWWEVHYLDEHNRRIATTVNEIHVPVNRAVRFFEVGQCHSSFLGTESSGQGRPDSRSSQFGGV